MSKQASAADPVVEYTYRFMDACLKSDVDTIVSLYADTAVMMPPNEPSIFGKNELEEWHREYFAAFKIVTFEETEREVIVLDGGVVERSAYLVAIQSLNGNDRIRDDGRFLRLWKQEDGVWRIAQSMFNSIRPIGSGTSRFLVRMKTKS